MRQFESIHLFYSELIYSYTPAASTECYALNRGSRGYNCNSCTNQGPVTDDDIPPAADDIFITDDTVTLPPVTDDSVPTTDDIVLSTRSALSCDELGWTNADRFGSALVCGESDAGLGGCSGFTNWIQAIAFCESGIDSNMIHSLSLNM